MSAAYPTLVESFSDLPDPRVERTRATIHRYPPQSPSAPVLCGAEGWEDMVDFAHAKRDWLQQRLALPNGIPCADTFRRVLSRLDPEACKTCFRRWTAGLMS